MARREGRGGRNQGLLLSDDGDVREIQPTWLDIVRNNSSVKTILQLVEADANEPIVPKSPSPLSAAIRLNRAPLVRALLETVAPSIEEVQLALSTPNTAIIDALLDKHCQLPTSQNFVLALFTAKEAPSLEFLEKLYGAIPPACFAHADARTMETPLLIAAKKGWGDVVEWLIKHRVPTTHDAELVYPLHHAVMANNSKMAQLLIQAAPHTANAVAAPKAPGKLANHSPHDLAAGNRKVLEVIERFALQAKVHSGSHSANMWCFGSNTWGQADVTQGAKECGVHSVPIFAKDEDVQQVACGYFHNVILLKTGLVLAYGKGNEGQLGVTVPVYNKVFEVPAVANLDVLSVAAGKFHSAALLGDGRVVCWGQNQISCSSYRTFIVDTAGAVWASDVRDLEKSKPIQLPDLANISKVACGLFHSVALSVDGDVYMWAEEDKPRLIDFFSGRAVCDVAAAQQRTFALTEGGEVYLWERDPVGKVIRGPEQVRELQNVPVVRIACGDGFTMALAASWTGETKVYSWGVNGYGQLGRATHVAHGQQPRDDVPAVVTLEGEFNDISCGGFHALLTGGRYMGIRSSLTSDLLSAMQSGYLSDFNFVLCGGAVTMKAHQLLLLVRVPLFVNQIGGEAATQVVVPESICKKPSDFAAVLGYLYGGRIAVTQATAYAYMTIAAYLTCPSLFHLCKNRLRPAESELKGLLSLVHPTTVMFFATTEPNLHLSVPLPLVPNFADVAFVVEGHKRLAHRWVVAARCPYFRALWASGMREAHLAELVLQVRQPVFDSVLTYIYSEDRQSVTADTCFEVLALAAEWQLDKLRSACESFMIAGLDADNAVSMLRHADLYSAARLKKAALDMARKNRKEAMDAEDWAVLPPALQSQVLGT